MAKKQAVREIFDHTAEGPKLRVPEDAVPQFEQERDELLRAGHGLKDAYAELLKAHPEWGKKK